VLSFLLAILQPANAGEDAEASLLSRVARGDRAALRKLYDRLSGQALAVSLRILGSRSEAEEVVQEVFLEVWGRAASFDVHRGRGRTWVLSIARNRAIDRFRSRDAAGRAVEGARAQSAPEPPAVTPLESAEQRETRQRIQAALATLSPEQRRVLELGYFEGLSHSEMAEKLGEPLGTVKSRVRLALEKLAQLIDGGLK
jgi:RNA polymerase sigma-70 factor (ECF subfamily)